MLPSPILRCVSRPRSTALRRATGRSRGAAAARWGHGVAASGGRWEARGRGGGAQRAFIFPSRILASHYSQDCSAVIDTVDWRHASPRASHRSYWRTAMQTDLSLATVTATQEQVDALLRERIYPGRVV